MPKIFYLLFGTLLMMSCQSRKYKDVVYSASPNKEDLSLNIFVPNKSANKELPVLIFVHGGNWNSGNKNQYSLVGRNFARKEIVSVLPSHTLSPLADVDQMTTEIATAIKWVQKNISSYNGDPAKIFVTGHSSGAHLIASAVLNPKYGLDPESISGIILNDAAGIDMKDYLEHYPPTNEDHYLTTWSNDPEKWYQASPINFLAENSPPFLIYLGEKTYPSITIANEHFVKELNKFQPKVKPIMINRKHIPMVLQYFFPWSDRYDETKNFIDKHSK